MPSLRVPGEKKIRKIRASNQKHNPRYAKHEEERALHFCAQMSEALIAGQQLDAAGEAALFVVSIDARTRFLQLRRKNLVIENVERGLRLRDADFRFAARQNRHPAVPRILQAICWHGAENRCHHHGHANIRIARHFGAVESRRSDANDANRIVV